MLRLLALAAIALSLAACGGDGTQSSSAAASISASGPATASATVGGATLAMSTVALADINEVIAGRYGIERGSEGVLLLVTVRDAAGNGIEPGDLRLSATASALPDPPKPLDLRAIRTDGMTDYIGVFAVAAPASVQFRVTATRAGARADIATTADLQPR